MTDTPQVVLPDGVAIPREERRGPLTITLARPVKHGEREYSTLELPELTGAHVRKAPDDVGWRSTEKVLEFAGQLTTLPPSVFDQLVAEDLGEVIRGTFAVAWPCLDLPAQWEGAWARKRAEAEAAGRPEPDLPRELPRPRAGHVLELERSVEHQRTRYERLTFGEMTGKLMRRVPLDGLPLTQLPWLAAELAGVPLAVVDQLRGVDLNRALALAQLFFLRIRPTTATSG